MGYQIEKQNVENCKKQFKVNLFAVLFFSIPTNFIIFSLMGQYIVPVFSNEEDVRDLSLKVFWFGGVIGFIFSLRMLMKVTLR